MQPVKISRQVNLMIFTEEIFHHNVNPAVLIGYALKGDDTLPKNRLPNPALKLAVVYGT